MSRPGRLLVADERARSALGIPKDPPPQIQVLGLNVGLPYVLRSYICKKYDIAQRYSHLGAGRTLGLLNPFPTDSFVFWDRQEDG